MTTASSAPVSSVLRGRVGPMVAPAVVARLRHLAMVLGLKRYCAARARAGACRAWNSARTRGVVRA